MGWNHQPDKDSHHPFQWDDPPNPQPFAGRFPEPPRRKVERSVWSWSWERWIAFGVDNCYSIWRGEGPKGEFFWLFVVCFFLIGRIEGVEFQKVVGFFYFYLRGDVVISTSSWSSLSPFYVGNWFPNLTLNTFLLKNWLPIIDPTLNPIFFQMSQTRAFLQAGSPGNAQSYGCCIAGMPRSDSPEWFWDTSMAIGRWFAESWKSFFFATNFLIAYRICRNLGTSSETKKKTHKQTCISFFGCGGGNIKKTRNSSIIHWFRRYYHWDGCFLLVFLQK